MEETKIISNSTQETIDLGKKIGHSIIKSNLETVILMLIGELGSGKTTFTKGLLIALGIQDSAESPTFIFLNVYQGETPLYHFDLYRVSNVNEIDDIGILEFLEKKGIIVIEWGEKLKDIVKPDIKITIKKLGESQRELTFEYLDPFEGVFYENFVDQQRI